MTPEEQPVFSSVRLSHRHMHPRRCSLSLEIRDTQRQNAHMTISPWCLGWGAHTRYQL